MSNCENEESIKNALKRLGSEGRKFGIILIAINQSSNVDDIGISGPYRANFLMILLGASARSISERTWKATDDRAQWIEKQVYACCVAGCVAPQVAIHPTHGTYGKFRKKGNPPLNLLPINQLPHTFLPKRYRPLGDVQRQVLATVNIDLEGDDDSVIQTLEETPDIPRAGTEEWEKWLSKSSTEDIDRLIDERRSPPKPASSNPEGSIDEVQYLEISQDAGCPKGWNAEDFRKFLPGKDEEELLEKLLKYLDSTADAQGNRTKSYSNAIKLGLGFTNGDRYKKIGLPCFRYLLGKEGRESLKEHFKKAWDRDDIEE